MCILISSLLFGSAFEVKKKIAHVFIFQICVYPSLGSSVAVHFRHIKITLKSYPLF